MKMKLSNFKMSSIMSNRNAFSVFICMEAVVEIVKLQKYITKFSFSVVTLWIYLTVCSSLASSCSTKVHSSITDLNSKKRTLSYTK